LPEPPTEFQRFVAATAGRMLPIYGARLFAQQAASFVHRPARRRRTWWSAPGQLRIRIWGQVNFSANLQVSREGEIYLPKVGAVHVAGLEFSSVAGHLRQAIERVYRNFELSVDMARFTLSSVHGGEARQPGEYTVSALSTLVDAVFLAAALRETAPCVSGAEARRQGAGGFDLYALLVRRQERRRAIAVGDVLFIPRPAPKCAHGSVRQAAIYELRGRSRSGN